MDKYRVVLVLKVPSTAGKKLDFRLMVDDVIYAVEKFNKKFSSLKEIKLEAIEKQKIKLLFYFKQAAVSVDTRDLTMFSKRLSNDRGWNIFSREEGKLFTAEKFEPIDENVTDYDALPVIPVNLKDELLDDINKDINSQLTDDECAKALQSLISIQNIGDIETQLKRKKSVTDIKKILISTLS